MEFSDFFKWFYMLRFAIFGFWVIVLIVCGIFAFDFLDMTNVVFIPPDNSLAAKANKVYEEKFPDVYSQGKFVVLMQLTDKNNTDYPHILAGNWTQVTTGLIVEAAKNFPDDPDLFVGAMGRYTFEGMYSPYDPIATQFLSQTFVSQNNRSSIMILATREKATQHVMKWVRHMRKEFTKIDKVDGTFSIDIIGFDSLKNDMTVGARDDLKIMDAISLPIALVVFIIILQSLTVAIIPAVAVGASLILSFAVMIPVADAMNIPSYCPAIMMSIVIAMSIDYCLFLLSRFHEEISLGHTPLVGAENMLRYSGETILKSGGVFTVCLVSLTVFPLQVIVAIGIAAIIALLSTMLVALTLIPSIVCIGLRFFSIRGFLPCLTRTEDGKVKGRLCCCDKEAHKSHVFGKKRLTKEDKFEKEKASCCYRISTCMTHVPNAIIVAVVVCLILTPFCCGMIAWDVVIDEDQVLPRKSETHDAVVRFSKEWPVGELYSFDVIAVPKNKDESLLNPVFYQVFHNLAVEITSKTDDFSMTGVLSPCDLGANYIDFSTAYSLLQAKEFAYSMIVKQQMNGDQTAARMTLAANINPNHNASRVPLELRPILDDFTDSTNYSFYLVSQLVDMHDAVTYTFEIFPYIIIAMAVVIILMVLIAFQAPILSLQMLFTIAITLVWSYGVISVIFATNWFYGLSSNISDDPGICWVVPILSLPILIGLSLDYNIFLFTRIHEYRAHGWTPRTAVIKGVTKSSVVILYAGVIMAVAFSGLMFSGLMLMNQFGVLLFIGVLLDTFVITTTLNPSLIYLLGRFSYWPCEFPEKYDDPEKYDEESEPGHDKHKKQESSTETKGDEPAIIPIDVDVVVVDVTKP